MFPKFPISFTVRFLKFLVLFENSLFRCFSSKSFVNTLLVLVNLLSVCLLVPEKGVSTTVTGDCRFIKFMKKFSELIFHPAQR